MARVAETSLLPGPALTNETRLTASRIPVLELSVDVVTLAKATRLNLEWARSRQSRYSCLANVHMTMEAFDNPSYGATVNRSDLVLPDGLPLVWAQRLAGRTDAQQVRGTDLLRAICKSAELENVRIGFLGGRPEVLVALQKELGRAYPQLEIALAYSPPFRSLSEAEQLAVYKRVNASGAQLLFVGLGCPKQERWMEQAIPFLRMPMVGVGAAFDFIAGSSVEAPRVAQELGLEWLFRLCAEPGRLWRRYMLNNPRFLYRLSIQLAERCWIRSRSLERGCPRASRGQGRTRDCITAATVPAALVTDRSPLTVR